MSRPIKSAAVWAWNDPKTRVLARAVIVSVLAAYVAGAGAKGILVGAIGAAVEVISPVNRSVGAFKQPKT